MPQRKRTRFRQLVVAYLSEVRASLFIATLCTLGVALTDLLRPWPLKIIFDNILLDKPLRGLLSFLNGMFHNQKTLAVVLVSLSIVLITLLKSASGYLQLFITSRIGFRLAHAFRRELFNHLQKLSISFFKRAESGEIITKVTSDTNNLRDVFTDITLTFASEFLTLVGMLVIMIFLNWKLSLVALSTFPVLAALSLYRYRTIKDSARRQRKAEGKIATRLAEILNSVPVVQAFGREKYEEERFTTESERTLAQSIRTARLEAAASRAVDIISAVGTWAVILLGSLQALAGRMTPGSVFIFASYMNSMYGPIRSLAKLSAKFSKAAVSAQRISEILEIEPEIKDAPDAIEASGLRGEIVFDNVTFDYGDGRGVLQEVSFKIEPGRRVVLLGPSGAGKSTICGLILRFYDPQSGSVSIDGVDIRRYKRESLRREIGIVLQDSLLFGATVRENIAYGKLGATEEEIVAAARAAGAHDFICVLENGYDTVVGERGGTLSGGQRQRISIARTFIRDVPVLILDEMMTGLDVESAAAVRAA
ncbi:MAG: ABC transporter ATP-binding protein/permease, partial [Acidobacteriota bacterium]|nr:ABC transporter ATP-binding protein/permease [Acidobacteriota bacterium]